MRVWVVSDIHTDYKDNLSWLQGLPEAKYKEDTLILAGDVSDDLQILTETLAQCKQRWKHVFFTPGNHEVWIRKAERGQLNSVDKFANVLALCDRLHVQHQPAELDDVWIVPIHSWYHASWDAEPDIPDSADITKIMTDFHACQWPDSLLGADVAQHMDRVHNAGLANVAAAIKESKTPVISFSHFLPRQELLPEKRMLFLPNLAKAAGSSCLLPRIQQVGSCAHIFGHTHFAWDACLDGVRYVQWPLGYPRERRRLRGDDPSFEPLLLYDSTSGFAPPQDCFWSTYYQHNRRDPANLQPAPWVAARNRK